jgi:hypothetical protein
MPHQKLLFIMIRVGLITTITTLGRNFPLQEVAQPGCRWTPWASLDENCKIDIIAWSKQEDIGRLLFSALWGTNYQTPLTPKSGGHPSLDMPTSEGTPVYAIHAGEVMSASERSGYGLSITIKHDFNGKTIFSNYSHLSELLVKKGDRVEGNKLIGRVGCTGFSISGDPTRCGNHLDFQITTDKSPSHPYGYGDCVDGYMKAVEEGSCAEKLRAYTIDPLDFFATNTTIAINYPLIAAHIRPSNKPQEEHTSAPKPEVTKPRQSLQSIFARLREQNSAVIGNTPAAPKPQPTTESLATTVEPKPTTKPLPETISPVQPQLEKNKATVDIGTLQRSWNQSLADLTSYKVITLSVTTTDKLGNAFIGTLPQAFRVTVSNADVGSFFPEQFTIVNTDKKHLFFQTRKPGSATITFWYGETKIGQEDIIVK